MLAQLYPVFSHIAVMHTHPTPMYETSLDRSDSFMFWYKEVSAALVPNTCGLRDLVQQRSMVTIYTWVLLHEGRMVLFFFLTQNYLLVRSGGYAKQCEGVCCAWAVFHSLLNSSTCAYLLNDKSTTCCPSSSHYRSMDKLAFCHSAVYQQPIVDNHHYDTFPIRLRHQSIIVKLSFNSIESY